MKTYKRIAAMVLLICFMSLAPVSTAFARAGGGGGGGTAGGGGGGGTGGGGGPTSGYTSRGASRSHPISSILGGIVVAVAASGGAIVLYCKVHAKHRKAKRVMKSLEQYDPSWNYENFRLHIQNLFYTVQEAWAKRDQEIDRQYLSRKLYEQYKIKSEWMIMRHEQNILQKMQLIEALPIDINDFEGDSCDYMWVYIKGRMVDYTIDDRTMEMISGSKNPTSFVEYWKLIKENGNWVLDEIRQKDEFSLNSI